MKTKETRSPLAAAVDDLEHTLRELDRHATEAQRHPLDSEKHLQQVASSLRQLGELEGALQERMAQLTTALGALGEMQQRVVSGAAARANELQARHNVFLALMERSAALGTQAGELQTHLAAVSAGGGEGDVDVASVVDKVAALVIDAEALEAKATEDNFVDVVKHARSLRQQLSAAHTGLLRRVEKAQTKPATPPTTTSSS